MPYYSFHALERHATNTPDEEESEVHSSISRTPFSSTSTSGLTSVTSHNVEDISASPTPSILSLSGSMRELAVREEFGRRVNTYSDVYRLAADKEEIDRLAKQHILFKEVIGSYPSSVYEVMANNKSGETLTCLDLGCGSGSWLFDFARDFPEASVVGVDLVPLDIADLPHNCRCEVDDINLGLDHFYGTFNVVHARLIASGIKDYQNLVNTISRVLRPGGVVIFVEWDFCLYDINKSRIDADIGNLELPWWARWIAFARVAIQNCGGTLDVTQDTVHWIHANPFYEKVTCEEFWIPGCQWDQADPFNMRIGASMRDDTVKFVDSGRPLLLSSGLPEPIVDQLQSQATAELKNNLFPHYIRMQRVHARRKAYL